MVQGGVGMVLRCTGPIERDHRRLVDDPARPAASAVCEAAAWLWVVLVLEVYDPSHIVLQSLQLVQGRHDWSAMQQSVAVHV